MAHQTTPNRTIGNSDNGAPHESLDQFRFTFSCPSTNSSKGSFIEPDPNPEPVHDPSESLSESVLNYPEEFGRTFHAYKAGSYAFPNDQPERDRLSFQSEIITALFGDRLFFSPLTKNNPPRAIFDVATGTGEWAIQMGDYFPQSEIVATDLSPIQPTDVPPKVNFYVEDSSEPWEYSQKFDFIHTRVTAGCWSSFKTQVAEQAFESLTPGGWFESHELDTHIGCDDGSLPPDGPLQSWARNLREASERIDRSVDLARHLRRIYHEVGFVDVHQRVYKIPTNGWPRDSHLKELGRMWERNMQQGLSGFTCALQNRAYGSSAAETEVGLVEVRRELSDTKIHAYMYMYAVWGRKPFPGEVPLSPESFH